jgi:hypothetical protein
MSTAYEYVIRGFPHGLAALFHRNLVGFQVTWTTDGKATRFATAEDGFARAREHGLKDDQFYAVAIWEVAQKEVA